jgi:hypothetical protein
MKSGIVTYAQPATAGGPLTGARWLGRLGSISALTYSYTLPGGPDQMTATLMRPPSYRTDAMDPGRIVQIVRGGTVIWEGTMMEPAPTSAGWNLTAVGLGNTPQNFLAIYSTWSNQNDAVNQAISRGLRLINPGISSDVWLGQQQDSGSLTITGLLNLFCTLGGFYWYIFVNPTGGGGLLAVPAYPQGLNGSQSPLTPTRLLTCTVPVPRTIGNMITTMYMRYQTSANTATSATYAVTSETNAAQQAKYGPLEAYNDVSSAGYQTAAQVQALCEAVLNQEIPASYSNAFTVRPGELLTTGGQPIDLGTEQAGTICQALITDFASGGDVVPGPITFLTGSYEWDDVAEVATLTPYQSLGTSSTNLLAAISTWIGGSTGLRSGAGGLAYQEAGGQAPSLINPGGPPRYTTPGGVYPIAPRLGSLAMHFAWMTWSIINVGLFLIVYLRTQLRMTSDKAYAVEARFNDLVNNGGTFGGDVTVNGNHTVTNDVIIGANMSLGGAVNGTFATNDDLTVGLNFSVAGNVEGTLACADDLTVGANFSVGGEVEGTLTTAGDIVCGSNLGIDGSITAVDNISYSGTLTHT